MMTPRPQRVGRRMASVRAVTDLGGDAGHPQHGLACSILASVPLLRALARVRTGSPRAADALARATLQRAIVAYVGDMVPERCADGDLQPWLLGLQRHLYAAGRPERHASADDCAATASGDAARGTTAAWQVLHRALLQLPDDLREALFLADGAGCDTADLARILGCGTAEVRRRVSAGRAALLAALAPPPPPRAVPPLYNGGTAEQAFRPGAVLVAHDRRPAAGRGRAATVMAPLRPVPPAARLDERRDFISRLNIALYRALERGCAHVTEGRALRRLIAREKAALTRAARPSTVSRCSRGRSRTNWLRLMFIAYACS